MSVRTTKTTCPYCGVGCGIVAKRVSDGAITVAGDKEHPANFGRLCSKGSALAETLSLDDRLLHPSIDGARVTWDHALDAVAGAFRSAIDAHGPDSVAFYVSGQILTEDYYVANKLMKGFIGSANIDTNSRLCMASSVAGHRRAFGADTVPGCYDDLDEADLVVLVGSNLAWCHPVLYQRLEAAKTARGTRIVVVDPRRTATCELADTHLALKPGSDIPLFAGLLSHLGATNRLDRDYIAAHTSGFDATLATAQAMTCAKAAHATGLDARDLSAFYELFATTERVVTVYSQGVNQSVRGSDTVNAIINCHLATGRIGKPGMGPFSVTGQPNAMGGREVGGLANMLAAHMHIEDADHRALVQRFWRAPTIATKPGLKAVDLFRAVAEGRIKALWIMATNPVDSVPEADAVRDALDRCPFVVVSDVAANTDTTAVADVLLPSLAWGEKSGTVTNSERRVSRQRAFLEGPGEARADWWQLAEVGKRLGHAAAFAFAGPHQIFDEYARLTATENDGARDLDLGGVTGLDKKAYDALTPFQWPRRTAEAAATRFFANGNFYTPDKRARFVATPCAAPFVQPSAAFPFVLNTGRVRDQWHTMTRTAKTPRLMSHIGEPFVEIHPSDARRCGLQPAHLAELESPHGKMLARVLVTERQQIGTVFVPMHWTDRFSSSGRVDALVAGDVDPVSGQPGLKHSIVAARPSPVAVYGLAVTRERPNTAGLHHWALVRIAQGWKLEFALRNPIGSATGVLEQLTGIDASTALAYSDARNHRHRAAVVRDKVLLGAVFTASEPVGVSRGWAAELLAREHVHTIAILAGGAAADTPDRGPIVCACYGVGRNDIAAAVRAGCASVAAVGAKTAAGTNCGSCRADISRLIADSQVSSP